MAEHASDAARDAAVYSRVAGANLREGPAVDDVLDLAGEIGVDLVVVGGRGPVKRTVLGGVSEGVVHHARQPGLVCPGPTIAAPK